MERPILGSILRRGPAIVTNEVDNLPLAEILIDLFAAEFAPAGTVFSIKQRGPGAVVLT